MRGLRRTAALTLAAALVTAPLSAAGSREVSDPGGSKELIAFVSGNGSIYTIHPSGKGVRKRSAGPGEESSPSWSPDRRRLAFRCRGTLWAFRGGDICVINLDGSGRRQLTTGRPADRDPEWSPDGTKIVFTRVIPPGDPDTEPSPINQETNTDIFVMDADGSNVRRLTHSNSLDLEPTWSRDGKRIAFVSYRLGRSDIWTMDASGDTELPLTVDPALEDGPAWSPDGASIAYTKTAVNDPQIWVADAGGLLARPIGVSGYGVDWSPDGDHLVFHDLVGNGVVGLFMARRDGTGLRQLFHNGWGAGEAAWSR